ncbi:unnamed protein product [Lymnaea stagnalis]|uniref:Uncharacterized protein n=1 Tax=Lymnaea stagnalis TaxID=6523 RepID=A0AAV2HT29_LYMST
MAFIALLASVLVLAVPTFQQPQGGYVGGLIDTIQPGNCYDRCYLAYQKNPSSYFVSGCVCNQYNFPGNGPIGGGPIGGGNGNCGYLAANCRASPGEYNAVFAYTFDTNTQACVKVSVYNTCVNGYGASSNIFQTLQACNVACNYNKGY